MSSALCVSPLRGAKIDQLFELTRDLNNYFLIKFYCIENKLIKRK